MESSMRRCLLSISFASVLLASSLSAQTTVFSTFGPSDSYNVSASYNAAVTAEPFGFPIWLAAGFLYGGPSGDLLSLIRFAGFPFNTGPLNVGFLQGASIGSATTLESWTLLSGSTPSNSIYSLISFNQPILASNQTYWLAFMPGAPSQVDWQWFLNDQGFTGLQRSFDGGQSWMDGAGEASPAFDVTSIPGAVVPEPATITLLATGLAALAALSRRRRKQV